MTISVLIATRNRAPLLAATLSAILAQDDPGCPFEIVVADNGSSDETAAVVAAAAGRAAIPVRYVREDKPGKSQALNTALRLASGDVLALTDDDVLPAPQWLRTYARAFDGSSVDFAAGRILPLWGAPPPAWMSPALYGVLAVPDGGSRPAMISGAPSDAIMPIGANMAVRRDVVARIGGWNPAFGKLHGTLRTGEDHEFALKMFDAGLKGVYEPEAVVQHRVPADRLRRSYFRRWFRENGAVEAALEYDHATTSRYFLNVPIYLWRAMLRDVLRAAGAMVILSRAAFVAAEMRLCWFAGYAAARWRAQRSPVRIAASAAAPRN